jgi:anti-sigma B factor antagonist
MGVIVVEGNEESQVTDEFQVVVEVNGPLPVVRVTGDLDTATSPVLRRALNEVIGANPGCRVLVDLARMSFIDSTGLGVLVGALKRARNQSGDVLLARVTSMTAKVLEITGMDRVIEVVDLPDAPPAPAASFAHN